MARRDSVLKVRPAVRRRIALVQELGQRLATERRLIALGYRALRLAFSQPAASAARQAHFRAKAARLFDLSLEAWRHA